MLSCKQASRLLSDQQERTLPFRQRAGLRLHLWLCAECRRFDHQLTALRRALRGVADDPGCCRHQPLPEQARRRIEQTLKQQAADADKHRL